MKPHIAKITVSAKKGHSQVTRWLVTQDRPHPRIGNRHGGLEWENGEKLVGVHKNHSEAPTIGTTYRCHLLRSDIDVANLTGDRTDHAGYDSGSKWDESGRHRVTNPAPGTIELRGKSLGELLVIFGNNPHWPDIRQNVSGNPTPAEREWLNVNIIPQLRAYIDTNTSSLKFEAVDALKADVAKRLEIARDEIDKAEKEIRNAIAKL
jgi:hypothetical protein